MGRVLVTGTLESRTLPAQSFPAGCLRECVNELNPLWNLVIGQPLPAVIEQFVFRRRSGGIFDHNTRQGNFPKSSVAACEHTGSSHGRVRPEYPFDFLREELHAQNVDQVLRPTAKEQTAIAIQFT